MADEQIIACPNCDGHGWRQVGDRAGYECPMCDGRGKMVIDQKKTEALPVKRMPRGYEVA